MAKLARSRSKKWRRLQGFEKRFEIRITASAIFHAMIG
jgi:hypothetical protein